MLGMGRLFAAAVFCAGIASSQVHAVVLDMEGIAPPNSFVDMPAGGTTINGFNLKAQAGANGAIFVDSAAANNNPSWANNGTDVLWDVTRALLLQRPDFGAFSIVSFDADFQRDFLNNHPFSNNEIFIRGFLEAGGTVSTTFTVDELVGFETFTFGAGWSNVLAVLFSSSILIQDIGGVIAYDNIVLVGPSEVPLPAALPLFATALAGGGLIAWRRQRKAAKIAAA